MYSICIFWFSSTIITTTKNILESKDSLCHCCHSVVIILCKLSTNISEEESATSLFFSYIFKMFLMSTCFLRWTYTSSGLVCPFSCSDNDQSSGICFYFFFNSNHNLSNTRAAPSSSYSLFHAYCHIVSLGWVVCEQMLCSVKWQIKAFWFWKLWILCFETKPCFLCKLSATAYWLVSNVL